MDFAPLLRGMLSPHNLIGLGFASAFMLAGGIALRRLGTMSQRARRNTLVSLMFFVAGCLAAAPVYAVSGAFAGLWHSLGIPRLAPQLWAGLPSWANILIALIASDGAIYAVHRWLHGPLGWPIHAIHHSDSHVNGFTTWRVHPLEPLATSLFAIVMLGWLGLPHQDGALVGVILLLHNIYVHLEVDIEHGPFRHLLASPRFHRWHHYDDAQAYTTNLANMFPFYDVIFGTYRVPRRLQAPIGAQTAGVPDLDFVRLMTFPFLEWAKMAARWWRARVTPAV
ncbi:hypothetical protein IP88_14470 [alpha proteobacterium AAP81b]|nr:hypothetical protein IP88_14470 [alpha proteobacterium AAP81b]